MKFKQANIITGKFDWEYETKGYVEFYSNSYAWTNFDFRRKFADFVTDEQIGKLKKSLEVAGIKKDSYIAVIFDDSNNILAISRAGKGTWIDFTDNFTVKLFKNLNFIFTDLKVY